MVSSESRAYLQELRNRPAFGSRGHPFDLEELRAGMGTRCEPDLPGVSCQQMVLGGVPCEWVLAPDADPDLRLLYLHGGGYVSGSAGNYLPLAAALSAAAGVAVLLPDYRLAPEYPFPRGLEDGVQSYLAMLLHGPEGETPARAAFIAGDSAGGGLTLAMLLVLRDRGLPLPRAAMPLSACADLTMVSPSVATEDDPICSALCMPVFRELYLQGQDPYQPYASPVYGDYTGLPPLLLQLGQHEMLRDDSVRVAEKARADGVMVELEIWEGQVHVFQIRRLPESYEAISHLAQFMRRHGGGG